MIHGLLICAVLGLTQASEAVTLQAVEPKEGQVLDTFLTAKLRWRTATTDKEKHSAGGLQWESVQLIVSEHSDLSRPIVNVRLSAKETGYRLAVRPQTRYSWQVAPVINGEPQPAKGFRSSFVTGSPRIDAKADDRVRYKNPRRGAHFAQMTEVKPDAEEPLSPWYSVKQYQKPAPPTFAQIKAKLPEPVWDGHADALDAYWYCWKTLCEVWSYAPKDKDHQAVSNLIGIPSWGPWGSTMVFDTAFITYFAKYAHAAYPFIEGFDNCYARQHENGFVCRESDRENREVYVIYPVNPPLFAWAEWEYYRLSGDRRRLEAVLLPIVKHYEWWMVYQRRENGLYWTNGFNEADDSPRNTLMHYAVSATSYQALTALCSAKIARTIGREDLAAFFDQEHRRLSETVNERFWDAKHRIYNDLAQDGRFITELESGKFCKHCHMFWPMLAEAAPSDRVDGMVAELTNPGAFFRRNGVPSLSADSAGYAGGPQGHGQYWRGSVWPPVQCVVQQGLKQTGHWDLARQLAEKYHTAVVETYNKTHDITENLAPDQPLACGCGKFVGWGGIGPIANLIEYVLGLDIDVPAKKIVWRIHRTEKHGIKNLQLGSTKVDLVCEGRASAEAPCRVNIFSSGHFTLVLMTGTKTVENKIAPGSHTIVVP